MVEKEGMDSTRQRILDIVRSEPGIHKHALCRALGLAWGTVSHHLYVLRSHGAVRSARRGRQLLLYLADIPDHQQAWLRALRDPLDSNIIATLQVHPRARAADVSRRVGANVKLVRRHLLGLQEEGLVERVETAQPRYLLSRQAPGAIDVVRSLRAPEPPVSDAERASIPSLAALAARRAMASSPPTR